MAPVWVADILQALHVPLALFQTHVVLAQTQAATKFSHNKEKLMLIQSTVNNAIGVTA